MDERTRSPRSLQAKGIGNVDNDHTQFLLYRKVGSKACKGMNNRDQTPKDNQPACKVPIVMRGQATLRRYIAVKSILGPVLLI